MEPGLGFQMKDYHASPPDGQGPGQDRVGSDRQ